MASVKKIKSRKLKKSNDVDDVVLEISNEDKKTCVDKKEGNIKKVRTKKIRMSLSKTEEQKLDKDMEREDKMSVMVIVMILGLCFIVGISLGYVLYRIALTGAI